HQPLELGDTHMNWLKRVWHYIVYGPEMPQLPAPKTSEPVEEIDPVILKMLDSIAPGDMEPGRLYTRASYCPMDVAIERMGRTGLTTKEIINLFHMECDVAGDPYAILGIIDPEEED